GQTGNGRAINNVVFIDTADQFFAYGGMGLYHRVDESITMTRNPLVMTVTRNDSTSTQDTTTANPAAARDHVSADSLTGNSPPPDRLERPSADRPAVDTIYMTADTLFSQVIPLKEYIPKVFELDREGGALDEYEDEDYGEPFEDMGAPMDMAAPMDSLLIMPQDTVVSLPDSSKVQADT